MFPPKGLLRSVGMIAAVSMASLMALFPAYGRAEGASELPPLPEHLTLPDCELGPECPIPFDHLSTQSDEPFMFGGKVLDRSFGVWKRLGPPVETFDDVRKCLVEEEAMKPEPNLLLIDWDRTGLSEGATVCLFRIGRSLGHPVLLKRWLEFHQFTVHETFADNENYWMEGAVYRLAANWTVDQYRARKPNWFIALTGLEPMRSYGRSISYDADYRIINVGKSSSTTLN